MFRTDLPPIIRSPDIVFTANGICYTIYVDCLPADGYQLLWIQYQVSRWWWWTVSLYETRRFVYQNKIEKKCILLASIVRIYHDARSSECQILHLPFGMLQRNEILIRLGGLAFGGEIFKLMKERLHVKCNVKSGCQLSTRSRTE